MIGLLPAAAVAAAVWAVTYLATVDWRHTRPTPERTRR